MDYNNIIPYKERRFLCKIGFHSYSAIANRQNLFTQYYVGCKHCFKEHPAYKQKEE